MGNVITILICVVLIAAIAFSLVKGVWFAAKKITIPIQVALFVVILVCIGRILFTRENARKLYDGIEQTGISQNMERTMRSALNMKQDTEDKPEATPVLRTDESAAKEGSASRQTAATERKQPPTPVAPPETEPAPKPAAKPAPDYSHLDKGKKTYVYALPFNAKVSVGFKDSTYRVIAESLGQLGATEKKDIGKMIVKALGEYVGTKISNLDKSKVSIESRYDDEDNQTHVYAVVPPDAIE